ncbi:MAG: 23S rRNA (pseudouridine(1915)-N(3))-methyltransferase RlmH [Clostridia bacterium]|nr:23S rRNA (pseudouridine(1915)-N(3))-methyltransferase RlmH [Clostridia bacterium]MBR3845907.1 23S rRNA (pseudouridine(1915)-N(3))-methyltransferase RlmH [Clostridia bacterium]
MLNVKIYVTGTLKEQYYKDAIAEYKKRLSAYCKLEIIEYKEYKLPENPSEKQIEQALAIEGERILSDISPRAYKVAMCVEGKQLSSEEFAVKLDEISASHGEIALIIGSSFGLSESLKRSCDLRMSVSKMTLTHQMMRVWLVEIIYRCLSISHGGKYHK